MCEGGIKTNEFYCAGNAPPGFEIPGSASGVVTHTLECSTLSLMMGIVIFVQCKHDVCLKTGSVYYRLTKRTLETLDDRKTNTRN